MFIEFWVWASDQGIQERRRVFTRHHSSGAHELPRNTKLENLKHARF